MMDGWLASQVQYWHWWVLGLVLLIFEVFAPGFFFLWLGIAAGVVGVLVGLYPELSWQMQLIAFGVLSVLAVVAWWNLARRRPRQSPEPTLNRRGAQYIGRELTLVEPIVNGYGFVHVDDTRWRVAGPDLPAGSQVRVVAVEATVLRIEPVTRPLGAVSA